ncbi:MAG: ChaN family lipoprotein [Bacteroidota bacterium]
MYKINNKGTLIYLTCLLCCLGLKTSFAQSSAPVAYKIYASATQSEISLTELVEATNDANVLFFGEEHNDTLAHWLQDTLYQLLLEEYTDVTLSLEMFETDAQLVLDEYLAGYITADKLRKDGRAWSNYTEAYASLVERARDQSQQVVAANTPRRYVSLVNREGADALLNLPKSSKAYLPPLPINTTNEGYYQRFQEIMGGAGHDFGYSMYEAQCTWDAGMAYSIFSSWRKAKKTLVFHLNGRFHTDYQQGTMAQLWELRSKLNLQNISCFPADDFDQPNWEAYVPLGDYIIISKKR